MTISFVFMTTLEKLRSRHEKVIAQLNIVKLDKGKTLTTCKKVGLRLNVSPQTVYNYLCGRVKDGFLGEAIIEELKKIN